MGIRKIFAGGLASILLSASIVGAVSAVHNLNGSFEDGIEPGAFTMLVAGDNTSIPGWTVTAGSIDYIGTYWASSDGLRNIDMTGSDGNAGAISKTFPTVVGHTYIVTFDLAGNPDDGPIVKTLHVDAGGAPTTYTFDTTGKTASDMGWASQTFEFTATAPSTTLNFTSMDTGFYGPALDNVVVTNVLTSKDQCKKGGWMAYTSPSFKNQGDCVSYLQSNPHAIGNRADN